MIMKENQTIVQPVVCCIEDRYVICVPVYEEALISVLINENRFVCDDNGVRKSDCRVHKIEVPMSLLNQASGYTIEYIKMIERCPYRSKLAHAQLFQFSFRSIKNTYPIRIAHLSDVHGLKEAAIETGSYFNSELDLLILNGDISSSSNNMDEVLLPLRIAYEITKGECPCIITRGNHDLRGKVAEKLSEIYPTNNGRMYYTVSFPNLRLLILDCGEDKADSHVEYGGTAAFHQYRIRETEFLKALVENRKFRENSSPLMIISHIPFPHTDGNGEFAIEEPLYSDWCHIIRQHMHPDLCLFGHHHQIECMPSGHSFDTKKINAPMILGGMPVNGATKDVYGTFLIINKNCIDIVFSNRKHQIIKQETIRTN